MHRDLPALPAGHHHGVGRRLGDVGQHAAAHDGQGGGLPHLGGQALQHDTRRPDEGDAVGLAGEVDQAESQGVRAGLLVEGDEPLVLQRGGAQPYVTFQCPFPPASLTPRTQRAYVAQITEVFAS